MALWPRSFREAGAASVPACVGRVGVHCWWRVVTAPPALAMPSRIAVPVSLQGPGHWLLFPRLCMRANPGSMLRVLAGVQVLSRLREIRYDHPR